MVADEQLMTALFEDAPCGFLTLDPEGYILRVNDTLVKWLNSDKNELLNGRMFHEILGPGSRIYLSTHLIPLIEMHGEAIEINMELMRCDGRRIPVLINAAKAYDQSFEKSVYQLSVLDITQRKLYENELLRARSKAEEKAQQLEAKNRELEQFSGRLSHDLKSPLNTISGMISLMKRKKLLEEDGKPSEYFSLIESNVEWMKRMVSDLLEFSNTETRLAAMRMVDLGDVCKNAVRVLHQEVVKSRAKIQIGELPPVYGSGVQLTRVFQNLISNALRYRSDRSPIVEVFSETSGEFVEIHVKDNGAGFDPQYREKIFDFMTRLYSDDEVKGSGMGLSICKKIVEAHGGSIRATSEPGKGSVFTVRLPRL
jgi:phosphoserine phosphatase RsbU/P